MNDNDKFVDMTCGCGRDGVYDMGNGKYSCNKYIRCPTYDELENQLKECRSDLRICKSKLNTLAEARNIINELV